MFLKKAILALSFAATFSLVACNESSTSAKDSQGDDIFYDSRTTDPTEDESNNVPGEKGDNNTPGDKSSSKGNNDIVHCTFTVVRDGFKVVTTDGDTTTTIEATLENDIVKLVSTLPADEDACKWTEEGTTCTVKDGNEVTTHIFDEGSETAASVYKNLKNELEQECINIDGMTKQELYAIDDTDPSENFNEPSIIDDDTTKHNSNPSDDEVLYSCKITSTLNSFEMTMTDGDTVLTMSASLINGVYNMTLTLDPAEADYCNDIDDSEICTVKDGVATEKITMEDVGDLIFKETLDESEELCNAVDGMTQEEIEQYENELENDYDDDFYYYKKKFFKIKH